MKKIAKYLIVLTFIFTSHAYAALELELTQGIDSAIPIAITQFSGESSISSDDSKTTKVVREDLKNSGRFRLVESSGGISGDTVDYNFWREQKADAVVTGQIQEVGAGHYKVAFQLYDIYNRNKLLTKDFTVNAKQLRQLAHHISDLIYQQLTGDRGVFATKIAYILVERHGRAAKYKFIVADADGYNPRVFLTSSFPLMSPAWSPDGKRIAYVSFEGNRAAIYVQDIATGSRRVISKAPGINGAPAWSPDGRKMALVLTQTGYPKIYILDLTSNSLRRVTNDWYLDTEPSWAADGKSIIFTSNRAGSNPQIYRVSLSDGSIKRLTYTGSYNARASFTADGKNIVMLHQDGNNFNIASQDLESGRVTVLTNTGFDESPSVAPNGKMVVYATNANGRGVLAEVSLDGRVKLLLPAQEGAVQEPAWSPFLN